MAPSRNGVGKSTQKKRTHVIGGCTTCRRRHVKCDQNQPTCQRCHKAGLDCEGFPSRVRWVSAPSVTPGLAEANLGNTMNTNAAPTLNTGCKSQAEQRGSIALVSEPAQIDRSLPGVDINSANLNSVTDQSQQLAPHSLPINNSFQITNVSPTAETSTSGRILDIASAQSVTDIAESSSPDLDVLFNMENILGWNDLFDSGFDFHMTQGIDQSAFSNPSNYFNPETENIGFTECPEHPKVGDYAADPNYILPDTLLDYESEDNMTTTTEAEVLKAAPTFLRYFKSYVAPQFGPLPMTHKSPWHTGMFTTAVHTLADMTYLDSGTTKHANRAILFGIIACATHHMGKNQGHDMCQEAINTGLTYKFATTKAKEHLRESLRTETSGPHKAKYKDQLMATIIMIADSTISGRNSEARCYLIDAERLLRLRGLAKLELSRRCRLLHHAYTWLRIIGESTFTIQEAKSSLPSKTTQSSCRMEHAVDNLLVASKQTKNHAELDDFLRVQPHEPDNDVSDLVTPKDAETGLRDIHLEDMRQDHRTMYLQIYGIPETWLSLVSNVTRLANLIDIVDTKEGQVSGHFTKSLQKTINRLEQMVCLYTTSADSPFSVISSSTTEFPDGDSRSKPASGNQYMLRAMNSALVIFFYRRVRKVQPWILQSNVKDVMEALKNFDAWLTETSTPGPGTPWPAFIAGCEAMSKTTRDWFSDWMEKASKSLASDGVQEALSTMRKVWQRRDGTEEEDTNDMAAESNSRGCRQKKADLSCTWVEILRESNSWLMLY